MVNEDFLCSHILGELALSEVNQEFDGCRLCWAISEQGRRYPENTILFDMGDHVVIPAVGSLRPGYLLIVSRDHKRALATLSSEEIECFETQLQSLIERLAPVSDGWLAFEHGSSSSCPAPGCCVDHFHFHLFPVSHSESLQVVKCIESTSQRIGSLQQIPHLLTNRPEAYIVIRDAEGTIHFFHGFGFPSQFVRQILAAECAIAHEWNWRDYVLFDNVVETLRLLRTNGLSQRIVYFAHAIEGIPESEIIEEITAARNIFKQHCSGFEVTSMFELIGKSLAVSDVAPHIDENQLLVESEVRFLSASDVLVADLSREAWRYVGCLMEIVYAKQLGVPVVAVCGTSGIEHRRWLNAHVDYFAANLHEAAVYIRDLS